MQLVQGLHFHEQVATPAGGDGVGGGDGLGGEGVGGVGGGGVGGEGVGGGDGKGGAGGAAGKQGRSQCAVKTARWATSYQDRTDHEIKHKTSRLLIPFVKCR